jgi:hypothetical protein
MMNPAYYRQRAQQVRAVAEGVTFQETKAQLLKMAVEYENLAVQAAEFTAEQRSTSD